MFFERTNYNQPFNHAYVQYRMNENDSWWKNYEKYLYFNRNNKFYIMPVLGLCFLSILCANLFWFMLCILFGTFVCDWNNRELDKDPNVVLKRYEEMERWRKLNTEE